MMTAGHNSIKRIAHRVGEEIRATREIASQTSWGAALETFHAKIDIQVMNHNGFAEPSAVRKRLIRKHEILLNYFEQLYGDYYRNYNYDMPTDPVDSNMKNCIWVCWWQGLENAPEIVKRCVESIQCNAGTHKVIVITDQNVGQYIDIPEWIKKKQAEGIISRTNLSDLLRVSLLAKYGGLWLDSTFFCVGSLSDIAFNEPVFSIKRPDYLHCSVAQGYFANYSIGCDSDHRWIFCAIRDFYLQYWKENNFLVDYLLIDYLTVLAQRNNDKIADIFSQIKPNNPRCDDLWVELGKPFDANEWKALTRDTSLFKLTWKQTYPKSVDGNPTFYGKLLDGSLIC